MPSPITTLAPRPTPACVAFPELFQNRLVEEPLPSGSPVADRRRQAVLIAEAEKVCGGCPLVAECLYRAVVDHDVAGYAGGTTQVQRQLIRRRLGVTVIPEDFDTLAGVSGPNRQVDHDEVVRLRHANPHESLETLAGRLGCSLSTVKRHLRRERNDPSARPAHRVRPTMGQVLSVVVEVKHGARDRNRAA
jgi:AraC-like DNA-binding protein